MLTEEFLYYVSNVKGYDPINPEEKLMWIILKEQVKLQTVEDASKDKQSLSLISH